MICTKDSPYDKNNNIEPSKFIHEDCIYIGDTDDSNCERYKCINCGYIWKEELPQ